MISRDRSDFKAEVLQWAQRLEVAVRSVTVRPMRNKWASCSTAGNFSFNRDVLKLEPTLQAYVIVHELLHSAVPNHGKLWKSLMRAHVGNHDELDLQLRRAAEKQGGPSDPG
jgi:predicted metal-dependent hydrolase